MDLFYQSVSIPSKRRVHFHDFMAEVHRELHAIRQEDKERNKSKEKDKQEGKTNASTKTKTKTNGPPTKAARMQPTTTTDGPAATTSPNLPASNADAAAAHLPSSPPPPPFSSSPVMTLSLRLHSRSSLLCFDELQVTDVCDALLLRQIFSSLFALGTVVVATSNRPPDELYEGGVNREYFLNTIQDIKRHCIVLDMQSDTDYRVENERQGRGEGEGEGEGKGGPTVPLEDERLQGTGLRNFFLDKGTMSGTAALCDDIFRRLSSGGTGAGPSSSSPPSSVLLPLPFSRTFLVPKAGVGSRSGGALVSNESAVCLLPFSYLCQSDVGSAEYRAVARNFDFVILTGVPRLSRRRHDEARRFITLVDELYEGRVKLVIEAEKKGGVGEGHATLFETEEEENRACLDGDEGEEEKAAEDDAVKKQGEEGQTLKWLDVRMSNGRTIGEIAAIRELRFAFRRAESRITEMTGFLWFNKH